MKSKEKKDFISNDRILFTFLIILILLLIASIVVLSAVPPISKDALVHHLTIPRLYLKHGGMYEIPSMVFSYYPMNLDLIYMLPLYFGNDIIPKFIHFVFALLTAWMLFQYIRHRINIRYGLLGVIFFLSIPIIIKLSISVYVDLGVIFFSTASLLLLLKWIEHDFRVRYLVLSAVCCGLTMGTKYNGLVTCFLLTLFIPFLYSRYSGAGRYVFFRPAAYGVLFLFIALIIYSPWMIRNYHWKNNPIYPLHNKWFNPPKALTKKTVPPATIKKTNRGLFTYRSIIYNETWWQIALLPVRIFFQGKDGDPRYFDGKLNPFLLFLPIFAFFKRREEPKNIGYEKKIMFMFSILFFGFAFFSTSLRIRYISPIIPPLVILSVFGIKNIFGIIRGMKNHNVRVVGFSLVAFVISFFFALNAAYIIGQFRYVEPFKYLNGKVSRDEYISKYRLEYPAMQYVNKNLPHDALILFVFLGKRGYYCDRKYVLGESKLGQLFKKSNGPEEVLQGLKDMGITHLMINYGILDKWVKIELTAEGKRTMRSFFSKYVKILFFKGGYGVSRLENSYL